MARWLALIAITQQVSCSGGGGSSNAGVDPVPVATVTLSPSSSQISAGASVQLIATVQNASNPAVTWQVNGLPGGNSSVGTITPSGAATASYMAPASVSAALTVTVTAVLQADSTKFGSATVAVSPSPGTQVTVSPANTDVVTGSSQQFTASVQNGPQSVIWEVDGVQLGNRTVGFISSSGVYTAPATIPNPPSVTITALLTTDTSVSGSTTLTVVAPPVSVSISPSTANVDSGETLQFSATVQNSASSLIWEVNSAPGGGPSQGTITSTGTSTATYSAPSVSTPLAVTVAAVLQADTSILASAGVTVVPVNTFTGVFSWRNDNALTGQNPQEMRLAPANVSPSTFGKLFGCPVDGQIFAQPLYVANVTIPSQPTPPNVVYVATENDSVFAFDADSSSCQVLWQVSFLDSGVIAVPSGNIGSQQDILPEVGITGTPVIDPATATLYVVSKTKAMVNGLPVYTQQLHALDLTTGWVGGAVGAEKFNGPVTITATVSGAGDGSLSGELSFDPLTENQRSALLLAGGTVYVAFDSYGDTDPFHGWLFAYDAGDVATAPAVFNSTPNGSRGGIGESGAAPSSDADGNLFVVASDGKTGFPNPGTDYPDILLNLKVNTTAGFNVVDTFTRPNETLLNLTQKYFGSTGVLLLPDSAGSSNHPHLAAAGDEAGNLYLLDRDSLAADGALQTLTLSGSLFGTPSYWAANNSVYVAAAGDNLRVLQLTTGTLGSPSCSTLPSSCSADPFPLFGASPVISWDGSNSASGIVWALDTSGSATSSPAILHAYDATNLGAELYSSSSVMSDAAGLAVKFAVPTVANGKVYVGTQTELSVYGLLPK